MGIGVTRTLAQLAHRYLPIVVSYNHQVSKHSIYLLKKNPQTQNKSFLSQHYFPSTINQQSESTVHL